MNHGVIIGQRDDQSERDWLNSSAHSILHCANQIVPATHQTSNCITRAKTTADTLLVHRLLRMHHSCNGYCRCHTRAKAIADAMHVQRLLLGCETAAAALLMLLVLSPTTAATAGTGPKPRTAAAADSTPTALSQCLRSWHTLL